MDVNLWTTIYKNRQLDADGKLIPILLDDGCSYEIIQNFREAEAREEVAQREIKKYTAPPSWQGYEFPTDPRQRKTDEDLLRNSQYRRDDIYHFDKKVEEEIKEAVLEMDHEVQEAVTNNTHEDFLKSLNVFYLDGTEVKLLYKCKRITKTGDDLGFKDSRGKAWNAFLEILQNPKHVYSLGPAFRYDKVLNKKIPIATYGQRLSYLKEIDKKLISFLAKQYGVAFPRKFALRKHTTGKGEYTFKFQMPLDNASYATQEKAYARLEVLIRDKATDEAIQQAVLIAMDAGVTNDEIKKLLPNINTRQSDRDDEFAPDDDNYNEDDDI